MHGLPPHTSASTVMRSYLLDNVLVATDHMTVGVSFRSLTPHSISYHTWGFAIYLGEPFQNAVNHESHVELYDAARDFVVQQSAEHQSNRNTKLAFRYSHLLHYFDAHKPPGSA